MIDLINSYSSIFKSWEISEYDIQGFSFRFKATLKIKDNSTLVIKEYYFNEVPKRKNSYHWMNKNGEMLIRWDNSEHWKAIDTYPHHAHHESNSNVQPAYINTLVKVLEYIFNIINGKNAKNKQTSKRI